MFCTAKQDLESVLYSCVQQLPIQLHSAATTAVFVQEAIDYSRRSRNNIYGLNGGRDENGGKRNWERGGQVGRKDGDKVVQRITGGGGVVSEAN